MRRRDFIAGLSGVMLLGPRPARAENRVYHLGTLHPAFPVTEDDPYGKILVKTLAQYGYVIGQNLTFDARGAMGDITKLRRLVDELKARDVDAIVVTGYPAALAAKSSGIPTVGTNGLGDPVETRLITSLSHPGGNITGISDDAAALTTKRMAMLKEAIPKLRSVAVLWNKNDLGMQMRYQASAKVAESADITVMPLGVGEPNDFDEAFAAMDRELPDAILMVSDTLTSLNRKRVFKYAAERKLPAIYEYDFLTRDGGLMSYGADLTESFERTGDLVSRIFKGAQPGDLPFEQPTRYPFVINLRTAKDTGIELPPDLVALADEVIE